VAVACRAHAEMMNAGKIIGGKYLERTFLKM
jgi:hypothetical protein